ncbi:hypothetical protein [Microbacterium sp. 77mftsu3.1]|uniref:hypothetical protein n=1 Tax=Microbacterium sp. 77mftsu3.1 TaxID=1761802 RepID=UPI00037F044E|nr:hypothetical protein [Microbacterium sp. 77mftsu3.1]SDH40289.1 hypothetical protein SAMN04488590_3250 [Microbacterium sp. 77mftsu3.1]
MTTISTASESAREGAREKATGRFGDQQHSAPEVTLTDGTIIPPKQLGIIGMGPASENSFAEKADRSNNDGIPTRPLRPYLALTPGDDDEFFDAPVGSELHVRERVQGGERTRRYVHEIGADRQTVWRELAEHSEAVIAEHAAGDVWASMFEDTGHMRSARLHTPVGVLYSDRTHYVTRDRVDIPMTLSHAKWNLSHASRIELVSASQFGDTREDGIPAARSKLMDVHLKGDVLSYGPSNGSAPSRSIDLSKVQLFTRDGNIVIRKETDPGYGFEETIRIAY